MYVQFIETIGFHMVDNDFDEINLKAALRVRTKTAAKKVARLGSSLVVEQNEDLISLLSEMREQIPRNKRTMLSREIEHNVDVVVHGSRAEDNVSPAHIETHAITYRFPIGAVVVLDNRGGPVQVRLADEDGRYLLLELLGSKTDKRWYIRRVAGFAPLSGRRASNRTHGSVKDVSSES